MLSKFDYKSCEKLIFELAWRELFHHVWLHQGDSIFEHLEHAQAFESEQIPEAVLNNTTGIHGIDRELKKLSNGGIIYNHARMWVASLVCNFAKTSWKSGARWMYCLLLDGDLASN